MVKQRSARQCEGMNSFTEEPGTQEPPADGAGHDTPTSRPRPPLRRPVNGRMLAGVAAGIGQHFNVDVTIVRIVFAVLTIVGFTGIAYLGGIPLYLGGIPLYLACWLLIPEEGSEHSIAGAFLKNRQSRSS
jgi:phage shock protein PspC (stress-responsive transcriptional regulator)